MKCISQELNNQKEIAFFLGMDENLIEKVLSELLSKDLIKREDFFKLTQLGLDGLEKQTILAPIYRNKKTFYIDALNGKLREMREKSLLNPLIQKIRIIY